MSLDNMQYHTPATRFTNRFCGSAVPSLNGCFFACSDSFRKIFCRKTAGNLVVTKNRILSLSLSLSLSLVYRASIYRLYIKNQRFNKLFFTGYLPCLPEDCRIRSVPSLLLPAADGTWILHARLSPFSCIR